MYGVSEPCVFTISFSLLLDILPRCCCLEQFLDTARIRAIIINEGITMHRVVFYLAFIVEGSDKMVVAFENLKPRLDTLVKIYR